MMEIKWTDEQNGREKKRNENKQKKKKIMISKRLKEMNANVCLVDKNQSVQQSLQLKNKSNYMRVRDGSLPIV